MYTQTKRGNFKIALGLSCSLLALSSTAVLAQEQVAQDQVAQDQVAQDVSLEEIIVTGSRVRGVAPVGSTVISMDRAEIEASPSITIDKMLKEIPQVFDLGVSENSRGQAGGSGNIVYGNTVNLRGIGPYSTLVLIDGHRVVNNSRSTDPSVIPSLGVERLEVVADGASAIYGSDAVAGVVNIILRRTLDGAEGFVRGGLSDDGAFDEWAIGAAVGKVFDRGQFMLAYEHVERSNLNGDDRDFFRNDQRAFGGNDYSVTRCAPGTIRAGTTTYAIPTNGVTQATAANLVAGTTNRCDELLGQDLIPEQKYDSVNFTGTFDASEWVKLTADGFYSKRDFFRRSAFSTATITVPQTNAFFVRPAGFTGTSYTIDYNFRNDLPANHSAGFAESYQVTPGVKFLLPHDWQVEGLVGFGKTKDNSESYNGVNNAALNAALASSDPATSFDPYGLGRTSAAVRANLANQIFLAPTNGELTTGEVRLNGPLFTIGGGEVKLAAGYERQDFTAELGSARGNPGTPIVFRVFDRKVDSFYAEMYIPLVGTENAMPGVHRLEFTPAIRHDRYSDVGKTTNPKFGLNWSPVEDFTIRGSYGTAFRAPTIPEIYGNSNNFFGQSYQNPAGGAPLQGFALSGQNLNLKPEEATTWSIGADADLADNFKVSLTYFDVDYTNQVNAYLSDLAILTREAQFAGTGIIVRGPEAATRVQQFLAQGVTLAAGSFPGGSPANVTLFVDGRSQNLGKSITRGFDFNMTYMWDMDSANRFTFNAAGTYLTTYKVAITPAAPLLDQLDQIFRPLRLKARASVTWDHEPFSVRVLANHVGGYINTAVTPNQSVSSYTPIDLALTWRNDDGGDRGFSLNGLSISAEVRNLFNEDPPYVNIAPSVNGSGGYDATASNPIGRMFALTVRKSF
jgi:iron complex outermembrane receptor protein